jgi:hypothetical protein
MTTSRLAVCGRILGRPRTWAFLVVVGLAGLGGHWLLEAVNVDSCLDAGHVYDYSNGRCDEAALHRPVIPYGERHPGVVASAVALLSVGIVGVAVTSWFAGRWRACLRFPGAGTNDVACRQAPQNNAMKLTRSAWANGRERALAA